MTVHTFQMINGDWFIAPATSLLKKELLYAEEGLPTQLQVSVDKKKLELWYHDEEVPPKDRLDFARKTAQMALAFMAKYARSTRKGCILLNYNYKFESTTEQELWQ